MNVGLSLRAADLLMFIPHCSGVCVEYLTHTMEYLTHTMEYLLLMLWNILYIL